MTIEILRWIPAWIGVFVTGANLAFWVVIKFNDLKHLESSVRELIETLKETNKKLDNDGERIAKLEGRCTANHG